MANVNEHPKELGPVHQLIFTGLLWLKLSHEPHDASLSDLHPPCALKLLTTQRPFSQAAIQH